MVLDYRPPTPVTPGNWPGHVAYGLSRSHVESVISQGVPVVVRRRMATVDEEAVRREALHQAGRLWRRL